MRIAPVHRTLRTQRTNKDRNERMQFRGCVVYIPSLLNI